MSPYFALLLLLPQVLFYALLLPAHIHSSVQDVGGHIVFIYLFIFQSIPTSHCPSRTRGKRWCWSRPVLRRRKMKIKRKRKRAGEAVGLLLSKGQGAGSLWGGWRTSRLQLLHGGVSHHSSCFSSARLHLCRVAVSAVRLYHTTCFNGAHSRVTFKCKCFICGEKKQQQYMYVTILSCWSSAVGSRVERRCETITALMFSPSQLMLPQ